jgi:hypothetical protein
MALRGRVGLAQATIMKTIFVGVYIIKNRPI